MRKLILNRKLKLLHIIPSMNIGGREKVVIDLVRYIDKSKFDVEIACLGSKGTLYDDFRKLNVTLNFFKKKSGLSFSLIVKLALFMRKKNFDIVHCHNPGTLIYGGVSAKLINIPLIINTEHGYGTEISKKKILLETLLRNIISITVAVSNDLRKNLCSKKFSNKEKIITIYNGILCDNIMPYTKVRLIKDSFGFKPDNFIIGTVGRLEPVKDQKTLIESFKILVKQIKRAKLLIVGDGKERKNLQQIVTKMDLNNSIIFTGNRNDINEIFQCMDAFVLPSLSEGVSLTILEAIRNEIPVIATSVGGNKEIIENEVTGFLVPVNNPKVIAEKLYKIYKDKKISNMLIKNSKIRLLRKFNIFEIIKEYEKIYSSQYLSQL